MTADAPVLATRECPGCNVTTEKSYGCNHMTCVCGAHWCWECGKRGATARAVYAHMTRSHGGWYPQHAGDGRDDAYYDFSDEEAD